MAKKRAASEKETLRTQLREQRRHMDPALRAAATAGVNAKLMRLSHLLKKRKIKKIALYAPMGAELDIRPTLAFYQTNKSAHLYLPVYRRYSKKMWFAAKTPVPRKDSRVGRAGLDLLFIPLLAIDKKGYRLGQGGGYYDFFLKLKRRRKKPITIGVGFSWQLLPRLPHAFYDVPLHAFLSEKKLVRFSPLPGNLSKWL